MKRRLQELAHWLHARRSERSGILSLLAVACLFICLAYLLPGEYEGYEADLNLVAMYLPEEDQEVAATTAQASSRSGRKNTEKAKPHVPNRTDPNAMSKAQWIASGLSPSQADAVLKYKARAGGFRSREDLAKVFVLPDNWLADFGDRLVFPEVASTAREQLDKRKEPLSEEFTETPEPVIQAMEPLELNTADSAQLVAIRGIGPSSAQRLLNYRKALGGFIHPEQLEEVWGLHPNVRATMTEALSMDASRIVKRNINELSLDSLASHPYIDWKLARSLVSMRERKGGFTELNELREHHRIDDSLYHKLSHYFYAAPSP